MTGRRVFATVMLLLSTLFFGSMHAQIGVGRSESVQDNRNPLNYCKIKIINKAEVPAEDAGVLDVIDFAEGQYVEKGQLVGSINKKDAELAAKIAASEYEAARKTAENTISIEYAAKSYEVAKADYEASIEANRTAKGTVTKQQMRSQKLQAERSVMQAKMALQEAKIARLDAIAKFNTYQRAQAAIDRRDIISPLNGVVVKKFKHQGEWAQPGESVLLVEQMDRLWVEGDIDGTKYARHTVMGSKVRITVKLTGGEERFFDGKIVFASSSVESNEYTIRAEIENQKENGHWILSPGLDAKIEIISGGGGGFGF